MLYLLRRLSAAALVIFGAVTLVFMILYWLPGDPAALIAGEDAPAATVAQVRAQLGTDRPLFQQYTLYLDRLAQGDLGTSYATGEPVFSRLAAQIPATLALTIYATLVAVAIGIGLGILAAVRRGGWVDHLIQSSTLTFTSMPSFWLGIILILVFSVHLRWLPSIGNGSWKQLVLPVMCMGLVTSGKLTRMVRNNVLDVLDEPFVATLRGKGLLEYAVLYRHVLRNALIPAITLLGVLVGELLSGTVVVETLFARQGVGRIISEAVGVKDIPMIQGAVLFAAIFYVLINLLVDLSYGWIDRRIVAEGQS
jgi:ABC-type dipeptide/oligopeptide/nickel transport system permease component